MLNLPLHPLIVHFPIVLAFIVPLVALVVLVGQRTGWPSRTWWLVSGLCGVLAASSFAAVQTGQIDEDVVESIVGESAIETHEERAEAFALSTYVVFALSLIGLMGQSSRFRTVAGSVTITAALVSAILVVGVGHSGGSLVYEHGAATAHAELAQQQITAARADQPLPGRTRRSDDDRDGAER